MKRYWVAQATDLVEGRPVHVMAGEDPICLVSTGGNVFALSDRCSHEDTPLSEGQLYEEWIECPMHGSLFDLRTGAVTGMPAVLPVPVFPVTVEEGKVFIDV